MSEIIIYHNGECSKCKGALEILQEKNIPHRVRWYLAEPLALEELTSLLHKLQIKPSELVRRSEVLYQQRFADANLTEDEWLTVLAENPLLMQRPVVENGERAIIARPPERIFEII